MIPDWLRRTDEEAEAFMAWCKAVKERGEWGPSPGGACQALGCSRAMVDTLVKAGVLVRNEYREKDGTISNIRISTRSIEQAKANKRKTGKWTEA